MSEKSFHLEIITPRKIVFNGSVISLSVPGTAGGFQVLHSHTPLLSSLNIGEVRIIGIDNSEIRYAISSGFVEVKNNNVILLAESAEKAEEIDVERAKSASDRATKRIAEKKPETDFKRAQLALYKAMNRLKVAEKNKDI